MSDDTMKRWRCFFSNGHQIDFFDAFEEGARACAGRWYPELLLVKVVRLEPSEGSLDLTGGRRVDLFGDVG